MKMKLVISARVVTICRHGMRYWDTNYNDIQRLQDVVDGMKIKGSSNKPRHCEVCTQGKFYQTRNRDPDARAKTEKFLADTAPYGKVKCFRSNNGSEFTGKEYQTLLIKNVIKHQHLTLLTKMALLSAIGVHFLTWCSGTRCGGLPFKVYVYAFSRRFYPKRLTNDPKRLTNDK